MPLRLGAVPAGLHIAPPPAVGFALINKQPQALVICAAADSPVSCAHRQVAGGPKDRSQNFVDRDPPGRPAPGAAVRRRDKSGAMRAAGQRRFEDLEILPSHACTCGDRAEDGEQRFANHDCLCQTNANRAIE
jgi:hypothetical protein